MKIILTNDLHAWEPKRKQEKKKIMEHNCIYIYILNT